MWLALLCLVGLCAAQEPPAMPEKWTMRSNLYFGARTESPAPVMMGTAWFANSTYADAFRHACNDNDKLQSWGWRRHDGRSYGEHHVGDKANGVDITTEYVWYNHTTDARKATAPFAVRIHGKKPAALRRKKNADVSFLVYLATAEGTLDVLASPAVNPRKAVGSKKTRLLADGIPDDTVVVSARDTSLGDGSMVVRLVDGTQPTDARTHLGAVQRKRRGGSTQSSPELENIMFEGFDVQQDYLWQFDNFAKASLASSARSTFEDIKASKLYDNPREIMRKERIVPVLANDLGEETSLLVVQVVVQPPFTIEVAFVPSDPDLPRLPKAPKNAEAAIFRRAVKQADKVLGDSLSEELAIRRAAFDARFLTAFPRAAEADESTLDMAHYALSNLLGGMTYFYGSSLFRKDDKSPIVQTDPYSLVTAVPSRSFFPRGFLWDEGFHHLLVGQWDPDLSRKAIGHWLASMDENGWIAREQILGPEARSRVPQEFQVQKPDIANPPTLLLAIEALMRHAGLFQDDAAEVEVSDGGRFVTPTNDEAIKMKRFAVQLFPFLQEHYKWYKRTQAGPVKDSFQWQGATKDHTFASGLDDFPRGLAPTTQDEHVDLLAWMAMAARLLSNIASVVGTDTTVYDDDYKRFTDRLHLHWDDFEGVYCDVGLGTPQPPENPAKDLPKPAVMERVCHVGYVSLFPLLLQLLPPDSDEVGRLLHVMGSEDHLWSKYGLRSLSAADPLYRSGEDYWRGAIWININFLALQALKHYDSVPGPNQAAAADLHVRLREAVVTNIQRQFGKYGFLYENYDPVNGKGRGTRPFTGWSSLVVLILADQY